jgi:serine/threonine-protein kinase
MPALVGLSALQAFYKLVQAGLTPQGLQHLAPQRPLDVVDAQSPAPGAFLPAGSVARYFVPTAALMPALLGHTRSQAIDLLQAAGFNAVPQGPAFGMGTTVVVAQGAPANVALARGSSVSFVFKFQQGGGMPVKVQVPQLLGVTKQEAVAALQQKGLGVDLDHQGPGVPGPGTKVVAQVPPGGALVPPGTVVKVTYVEVAGPGGMTQVPALAGKTLLQAQQALAAANLGIDPQQGPNVPGGLKEGDRAAARRGAPSWPRGRS